MVLSDEAIQFAAQFREITENPKYQELKLIPRHGFTNTYDHSVRVAYMAYLLAQRWGEDCISAARIGLLHDFCMVDYHAEPKEVKEERGEWYCFYHPKDAIKNSAAYRLSAKEQRAILTHMFPLSKQIPNSRLAYMLTLADKTVALYEVCYGFVEAYARARMLLRGGLRRVRVWRGAERR